MADCIDLTSDNEGDFPGPSTLNRNPASDSDVELVEDEPPRPAVPPPANDAGADDDEDLVVTKAVGEVATIDYPHSRCDCGKQKFQQGSNVPSNALHCDNCYCFVCDVKAQDCTSWGTGFSSSDHCNAYGNPSWQNLRTAKRKGATAPTARQPGAMDLYHRVRAAAAAATAARQASTAARQAAPAPARKQRKALPNPAASEGIFELGTIQLWCEATGTNTIPSLRARLNPNGFYYDPNDPLDQFSSDDQLSLSNLFKTSYDTGTRQQVYCALKPIVDEDVAKNEISLFVRKVTLVHYDGCQLPTTYGLNMKRNVTVGDVLSEVEKLLPSPLRAHEELKLVQMHSDHELFPPWRATVYANRTDAVKNYSHLTCRGLWVYRILKPVAGSAWATVFHRLMPDVLAAANTNDENCGTPFLVALSPADQHGGNHACSSVTKAVTAYMQCFRAPQHGLSSMMKVHRYDPYAGWVGKPPHGTNFSRHMDYTGVRSGMLQLVAVWRRMPPVTMAQFNTPVVHESASEEIMKESARRLQEHLVYETQKAQDEELPYSVVEELKTLSRCGQPVTNKNGRTQYTLVPFLACQLTLEAVDGSEKKGLAKIKVFTWRKAEQGHNSVLQEFEGWPTGYQLHNMHHTMHLLARQSSESGRKMVLSFARQNWAGRHTCQSVKGLLESLQEVHTELAPHPEGMTVTLQHHQLQSLRFMQEMEDCEGGFRGRFWLPIRTSTTTYWYSPFFERICPAVPSQPCGGFLAEEMGLGKTVISLALMASRPAPASVVAGARVGTGESAKFASRGTLVVCAVTLAGQWLMEAASKLAQPPRSIMFHGSKARTEAHKLAANYDLVVTTYGMVKPDSPLMKVKWHRVIFDECHTLKQHTTKQTQSCTALTASRRWLCSGTPINNAMSDLFGQFMAMQFSPLDKKSVFDSTCKTSNNHAYIPQDFSKAYNILSRLMVRHTKKQVSEGEHAMKLPPKKQEDVAVVLTETELAAYNRVFQQAKPVWRRHESMGARHVSTHLFTIMSLLQPIRRICAGGNLQPSELEVNTTFLDSTLARYAVPGVIPSDESLVVPHDVECSICLDNMEAPVCTPCKHWFCQECITSCLNNSGKCPMCRTDVAVQALRAGVVPTAAAADPAQDADPAGVTVCNSKLRALLHELAAMQQQEPGAKALVFTQYKSNVAWLRESLLQHGYDVHYITGDMTARKREKAIEAFVSSERTTIFLLSMRTGAVGINLTAANYVYIMEPFLNPALEEQAVGRAWRMGQTRDVTVKRFYLQGSVEERIIQVAQQKLAAQATHAQAAEAVNAAAAAEDMDEEDEDAMHAYMAVHLGGIAARGRAARGQGVGLVGNITSDKQALRVEELNMLFTDPTFPDPLPANTSVSPERDPAAPGPSSDPVGYATRAQAAAGAAPTAGGASTSAAAGGAGGGGGAVVGVKRRAEEEAEGAGGRQVRQHTEGGDGGDAAAGSGSANPASGRAAASGSQTAGGSSSQPRGWMAYLQKLKSGSQE